MRRILMEVRRLRKAAGLTYDEVGAQMGLVGSTLSRMERGHRGIKRDDLSALLMVLGASRTLRQAILKLYDQADQPGLLDTTELVLPDSLVTLIGFEADAKVLRWYETLLIPGLVQTIPYARATIEGGGVPLEEVEVADRLAARIARQSLLRKTNPPEVRLVINEAALRQNIGGPEVMRGQLAHLLEVRASIRVVPFSAGAHPGLGSPFGLMDYESLSSVVALENKVGSLYLDDKEHVDSYKLAYEGILEVALPVDASAELIRQIASDLP